MSLVQRIYDAFSVVKKPTFIGGCILGCCMTLQQRKTLLKSPLREADAKILWHYPEDAIWTVGSAEDFKYFLPRPLELGLSEYVREGKPEGYIAFPETFGKKLALAGFEEWTGD